MSAAHEHFLTVENNFLCWGLVMHLPTTSNIGQNVQLDNGTRDNDSGVLGMQPGNCNLFVCLFVQQERTVFINDATFYSW